MKEKGSALILSILMLSFFMILTLTMFKLASNRSKISKYKFEGAKIDSRENKELQIKKYENYLSNKYVEHGSLYRDNGTNYIGNNKDYNSPKQNKNYTNSIEIDGIIVDVPRNGEHYTGITLNNVNEYFNSYWDDEAGTPIKINENSKIIDENILKQPWLKEEFYKNGELTNRTWGNDKGDKIKRLWDQTDGYRLSVGGYKLTKLKGKNKNGENFSLPINRNQIDKEKVYTLILTYEKIIELKLPFEENIKETYKITYVEKLQLYLDKGDLKTYEEPLKLDVEKIINNKNF